jgi:hypothetical protein
MGSRKRDLLSRVNGVVKSKVIGNNTVRYTTYDGREVIRYHHTDIITKMPNGDTVLQTNGWNTVTTKQRFHKYLDTYRIQSIKGEWYVTEGWKSYPRYRFVDGITIRSDGGIVNHGGMEVEDVAHTIRVFVNRYVRWINDRRINPLDLGQCCWNCLMYGVSEKLSDMDYMQHLREQHFNYYTQDAVIVIRAIAEFPISANGKEWLKDVWERKNVNDKRAEKARKEIRKSVYQYLLKQTKTVEGGE